MNVVSRQPIASRLAIAIAIGVACGAASWITTQNPVYQTYGQDFGVWWTAARELLAHRDPYVTMRATQGVLAGLPFNYPLPTALLAMPFAWMPADVAGPVFLGLSCTLLAFVATREAWWPLWLFASGAMIMTVITAQITPLIAVGVFCPALAWLGVFKPNLGVALVVARPSWRILGIMVAIGAASLLVLPAWPLEWLRVAGRSPFHFSPITTPGGILLLAALAKWRRPEARLLVTMAVLPSSPLVYEALFVSTIAGSKIEMILFSLASFALHLLLMNLSFIYDNAVYVARARPAMLWLIYIPALIMVLRRPNVGPVPAWLDRRLQRFPRWLGGVPA